MFGRIQITQTRGLAVRLRRETVLDLPLLTALVPFPGKPHALRAAGRKLARAHITRVLVPKGFAHWSILSHYGLCPVATEDFCRALAAPLALAALKGLGVAPTAATVALRGERVTRPMRMAALELCAKVRNVVVSAPVGGEALQAELRREFGVPNLEEGRGRVPDVAVHFSPWHGAGRTLFRLHGEAPELCGFAPGWTGQALPEDCESTPFLAALWETGKLRNDARAVFGEGDT